MVAPRYPESHQLRLPAPPVSLADFDAMEEDNRFRYEVKDGVLTVSPRPGTPHQRALARLIVQLDTQLTNGLALVPEIEVVLARQPLHVRIPDLVILQPSADLSAVRQTASDVLVAVEIVSPGSVRSDTRDKPGEYAEAGIPHYWLIDLNAPVSLTTFHLAGEFGYQEAPDVTGQVTLHCPIPVHLDLDKFPSR